MGKKAIISKHIVLCSFTQNYSHHPVYGIILIDGEIIHDVVFLDDNIPVSAVLEKYSEWNPQDCSNLYVSPGLIDLNVRREFENYTNLTKASVAGGVTLIAEEDGYYTDNPPNGELFCDLGKIALVDRTNVNSMEIEASKGCLAFKGYFYPPSSSVQALPHNLTAVFSNLEKVGLPMFIDPTLPDPRMLYMASPMRMESLESRNDKKASENLNLNVFAGAFSNAIESEGEDEDEDYSEDSPNDSGKRMSFHEEQDKPNGSFAKDRSHSGEIFSFEMNFQKNPSHLVFPEITEVEEEQSPAKKKKPKKMHKSKSGIYTIFDDLDRRIRECQQNIESLSLAEQCTYSASGPTQFSRRKSLSLNQIECGYQSDSDSSDAGNTISTPTQAGLYERRMINRRPIPIKIEKAPQANNKERIYVYHLANYPDYWEISGVEKLIHSLRNNISIHVVNISSAAAINKIRQARDHFPSLTCEIPASQLYFNSNSVGDGQTIFKNTPPIRNTGNCNLLWDLLKMKAIDCITSQHAFIEPSLKSIDTGNFQKALNGICTMGFTLQAIWTMLNVPVSSHMQLEHYIVRMSKWLSLHPSKILGLQDKRGSIEKGKYADLVIWAPYERVYVSDIYSERKEMSPFLSQNLQGRIHCVYIRGKQVFDGACFKARGKKVFRINTNRN